MSNKASWPVLFVITKLKAVPVCTGIASVSRLSARVISTNTLETTIALAAFLGAAVKPEIREELELEPELELLLAVAEGLLTKVT